MSSRARGRTRRPLRAPPPLPPPGSARPAQPPSRGFRLAVWLVARPDGLRLLFSLLTIAFGVGLALAAGRADDAFHRGVETGVGPRTPPHTIGRDLATNVDLSQFDPSALDDVALSLQQNGFRYVRQSFSWAELEPEPGVFRWDLASAIVDALDRHQITPVAVLHRSPAWARAPDQADAFDAPPADPAAYERFVAAFAATFGERVPYLQLWDQPNRADHWGNRPPNAADFARLLGAGFRGARDGNPTVTVVLAELDPAPADDGRSRDLRFFADLYAAGAAPLFDVAAARLDGGARFPFDRSADADVAGLSRIVLFREAMLAADDARTPIWATHYGWGIDPATGIDAARQAEFTIAGMERARAEWPWLGPLFAWGLRPGQTIAGDVPAAYALLGPNSESTPLLTAYAEAAATGLTDTAPTGFLPVTARQVAFTDGEWERQRLGPDEYRTTTEAGASVAVPFVGSGVTARLRLGPSAGTVEALLDGRPVPVLLDSFRAQDQDVVLAQGLPLGRHELTLRLRGEGELTIGGLLVERSTPLRWPITLLVGGGFALAFVGFRQLISLIAERTGRLQRRRGIDLWPELPRVPGWQPTRRA